VENASEEVQVYTDSSAMEGKVGAAATLQRAGRPARTLHYHLGPEKEHTVHEAELVGILLGLHLISTEKKGGTTCAIGTDNQAAIKAFHSDLRKPGHHLARESLRLTYQIRNKRRKSKYKLTLRWTAGHEGIEGNEAADQEAKKAAEGLTSNTELLPSYLRKPLLINPSAVKRAHNNTLKNKWTNNWKQSTRGRKMDLIDSTSPSKKFLKAISAPDISRNAASAIAQLRITHIPLNKYLKQFKRADNARCPACGTDEETIAHYLLLCPSYAYERWALARQAKKNHLTLTLKTLLGNAKMTAPLAKFIDATHRLSKHGEQTNA
jgi:ribonuclease HI